MRIRGIRNYIASRIRIQNFWIMDPDPYYLSKIWKNVRKKIQYFKIVNDLPVLFIIGHKNVHVGSKTVRICN